MILTNPYQFEISITTSYVAMSQVEPLSSRYNDLICVTVRKIKELTFRDALICMKEWR